MSELPLRPQLARRDRTSDEHRARHPLGRVPVLEDGDVAIFESGAIVEYVMARHGGGGLAPAVDAPELPFQKAIRPYEDDCLPEAEPRAWSSPIFVDHAGS